MKRSRLGDAPITGVLSEPHSGASVAIKDLRELAESR